MNQESKIKIGVMGSAGETSPANDKDVLANKASALGRAIAARKLLLLTGATTGIVYVVGKAAHDAGTFHVGISPAVDGREHVAQYKLPTDACDLLVYTGFGLKGRNVVLVRSCDVVLFIAGAMGSLNEFTIAHDEGKIIGCLTGTGGVADEVDYLLQKFSKDSGARVFQNKNPNKLLEACLGELQNREPSEVV
ncbi:MAG TPA: hypothetical protein DCK93_05735 [Blastocatellia bacterium]|jgi:uncharacterized protein (TIGR00725 family)|nr:hypothetical protein [Blastocatellia bacterium]HAF22403.1 hypothetical protein [Blastocatellia bacterium]